MSSGRRGALATAAVVLAATAGITAGQSSSVSSCVQLNYAIASSCPCDEASVTFSMEGETAIASNTVNLAVIVDGSGSVSDSDFELEKDFAKSAAASFAARNLFDNGGTASYVQFSTAIDTSGTFGSLVEFDAFVDADSSNGGWTNIGLGIADAQTLLSASPSTAAFMLVITDGDNNQGTDPKTEADLARAAGTTVFAVGVGSMVSDTTLLDIAGDASNVFDINGFDELDAALADILSQTTGNVISCPSTNVVITLDVAGTVTSADPTADVSGSTVTFTADNLEATPTEFRVGLDVCGVAAGTNFVSSAVYQDEQGTNNPDLSDLLALEVSTAVCDDPHLVGLAGQKIDWSGVDGGWYTILSEAKKHTYINVRVTAPLAEFPDRQLITGVAILEGEDSLVIEVEDPYTVASKGCSNGSGLRPCLADGALRILVNGQPSEELAGPADGVVLPSGIKVSASNLPVQCRPFGGDKIWAAEFARMMMDRRHLRSTYETFDKWIVRGPTVAAPAWCVKYMEENGGVGGLLATESSHSVFRIETPSITVRLNVGTNYQGGEVIPDGRVLPELEFWQMNLGVERLESSAMHKLGGLLGETAEPVVDEHGKPVMSGLKALHGEIEDYHVAGPYSK